MKEGLRNFSETMDEFIKTKKFRWFRTLIIVLGYVVTGCVCFLAGFFLNRSDNMIYRSNIQVMERNDGTEPEQLFSSAVNDVPEQTEETEQTTAVTVTEPPKVTLSRELLDSYIYEDLEFLPYEHTYTNTAYFKNRTMVSDFSIPLTKKSFTITYSGTITAGFDSEKIKVENDDDRYTITVTLPQAYIISHEIDSSSYVVENVQDNIFNPIYESDYTSTCTNENYRMEQKAQAEGLFRSVYSQAMEQITEYLNRDGIIGDKYTIDFVLPDSL